MSTGPHKIRCSDCHWTGLDTDLIAASNPFGDGIVGGCPSCRSTIGTQMIALCDEPGCNQEVCCGTPTPSGYRSTCHNHQPGFKK